MSGSKLDEWPCYKYGHRFDSCDIGIAYQKTLLGQESELKCERCGTVVDAELVENPVVTTAEIQRSCLDAMSCMNPLRFTTGYSDD